MPKVKHTPRRRRERRGKQKTVDGGKPPNKKAKRSVKTPVAGVLGTEIERNSRGGLSSNSSDAGLNGGRPVVREHKKEGVYEPETSHLSSGESTAEGREGNKRRRGASSESREEEGGERRGRRGVKEIRVSEAAQAKWKPVSQVARKLLSDGMLSALGFHSHSLDGLRGAQRTAAQNTIQKVMKRVEQEVTAAKAPSGKRVKSCADLKHRVAELKEKCIHLVDKNQEMSQRLEEKKLFCEERRVATQQLEAMVQPHKAHTQSHTPPVPEPPPSHSDEESFAGYIRDLISRPTTHTDLLELGHTTHDT